jgi:hypothetical protein
MSIKVSEIRGRLEDCPGLQQFVDFLAEQMMFRPFDARFAQLLKELNKITEAR